MNGESGETKDKEGRWTQQPSQVDLFTAVCQCVLGFIDAVHNKDD